MNEVNQVAGTQAAHRVESNTRASRIEREAAPSKADDGVDRAEFSERGQLLGRLASVPEIRVDKVADIRAQIEAGTYETGDKLDIAVERAVHDILNNT